MRIIEDEKTKELDCPFCDGTGEVVCDEEGYEYVFPRPCPDCKNGTVVTVIIDEG